MLQWTPNRTILFKRERERENKVLKKKIEKCEVFLKCNVMHIYMCVHANEEKGDYTTVVNCTSNSFRSLRVNASDPMKSSLVNWSLSQHSFIRISVNDHQ